MGHPSRTIDRGWEINSASAPQSNLDKFEVQPSPFDKLRADSAGLNS
jgi:hypothetical protein